jgi:hypothetical protein
MFSRDKFENLVHFRHFLSLQLPLVFKFVVFLFCKSSPQTFSGHFFQKYYRLEIVKQH